MSADQSWDNINCFIVCEVEVNYQNKEKQHVQIYGKTTNINNITTVVNNFSKTQDVKQIYISKLKNIILTFRKAMGKFCLITEKKP